MFSRNHHNFASCYSKPLQNQREIFRKTYSLKTKLKTKVNSYSSIIKSKENQTTGTNKKDPRKNIKSTDIIPFDVNHMSFLTNTRI